MSRLTRSFLIGIAPIALLALGTEVGAQANDVDCTRCVDTKDIATEAVATARIAQQAVTTSKIGKAAVTTSKIAPRAVATGKIADGAVTVDKVAPELSNSLGTACAPGEYVAGQDASGNFICKSLKPLFTEDCVFVNGLSWCFNNDACGEACNDVCAAKGLTAVADESAWFNAQNGSANCQVIADALGIVSTNVSNWTVACLEDSVGTHSVGGGLVGPLLCSTVPNCPSAHLTDMDQLGVACGANSRRSICPCE